MKDRINYYLFLPLISLAFLVETAFLPHLFWGSFQPPLVAVLLFAAVFLSRSADFLYTAFFFGFLLDLYAATPFGVLLTSLVLSAVFACLAKEKFLHEENFTRVAGVAMLSMLFYDIVFPALLALTAASRAVPDFGFLGREALYDLAFAALAVYAGMHLISNGKE
jgi:rod shape-determining protein MreD